MLPSSAFVFIEPTLYHIYECKENKDLRQLVAEVLKSDIILKNNYIFWMSSFSSFISLQIPSIISLSLLPNLENTFSPIQAFTEML